MRERCGVACVMLAALAVARCSGPDVEKVAPCVYLVAVQYHILGMPELGASDRPLYVPVSWMGSATAVSWDGDLLTARHVVDIGFTDPELCVGRYYDRRMGIMFRDATLMWADITVYEPGTGLAKWYGVATPATDGGPVCDAGNRLRLVWHPISDVTIAAVDPAVDLALLHIEVADDIPYFWLWTPPKEGMPATILGRPGGPLAASRGVVTMGCALDLISHPYHVTAPRMMASSLMKHGMSGGPVVSDSGTLMGINTAFVESVGSFAVPVTYAQPWYDWVKGRRLEPPPVACPLPTPADTP